MLVYESDEIICTMKPNFAKLKEFPVGLSVYVTAKSSDPAYDIAARAFWPKLNIDEDPVCGSMHTTLVPYWSRILRKDRIISRELSARGGTLYCELCGDRVKISGKHHIRQVLNKSAIFHKIASFSFLKNLCQ